MQYDPKGSQAKELNHAVAYFLAKDMQPYYTVEKPGFQKMIAKLNPRYKLPSRKYFMHQEISRLYNQVKETVVEPNCLFFCYNRLVDQQGNAPVLELYSSFHWFHLGTSVNLPWDRALVWRSYWREYSWIYQWHIGQLETFNWEASPYYNGQW